MRAKSWRSRSCGKIMQNLNLVLLLDFVHCDKDETYYGIWWNMMKHLRKYVQAIFWKFKLATFSAFRTSGGHRSGFSWRRPRAAGPPFLVMGAFLVIRKVHESSDSNYIGMDTIGAVVLPLHSGRLWLYIEIRSSLFFVVVAGSMAHLLVSSCFRPCPCLLT